MEPVSLVLVGLLAKSAVFGKVVAGAKALGVWIASNPIPVGVSVGLAANAHHARSQRREAERELAAAQQQWRAATERAGQARRSVLDAERSLNLATVQSVSFLIPHVAANARDIGIEGWVKARFPELFRDPEPIQHAAWVGKTCSQPVSHFETSSAWAVRMAASLAGIASIDRLSAHSIPVLHERVDVVIASLPIPGADLLAHPLSHLAVTVGDVLWGGLGVLSVFRSTQTRKVARAVASNAIELRCQADELTRQAIDEEQFARELSNHQALIDYSGYSTYKTIEFHKAMARPLGAGNTAELEHFKCRLSKYISAWEVNLRNRPTTA